MRSNLPGPRPFGSQRGALVLYVIMGLVLFGVLAAAGSSYFSSAMRGVLAPNCTTASRLMAESGLRYAAARLRAANTQAELDAARTAMNGQSFDVDAAKGLRFSLAIGYDGSGNLQVNATGQGCVLSLPVNASMESVSVNVPKVGSQPYKEVVDFSNVADDFFRTNDLASDSPISVDAATKSISFGKLDQAQNAAAIWYSGNATSGCLDGNCTMNYGLRAAFDIQWTSTSVADGLVFGIISAESNTVDAVGGNAYQGELMGWGGPALRKNGTMGKGVAPPKFGIEFDTYYNECKDELWLPGSRCDATGRDHMANVFWGGEVSLNQNYCPGGGNPCVPIMGPTFDDNRHGAGSGNASEPVSWANPDGSGSGRFGYWYSTTDAWLTGGTKYAIRHELSRIGTQNAEGAYPYILKTWIRSGAGAAPFNTVTTNYTVANPDMLRVVHLTPALHAKMAKVFFGWTEATGDSKQKLTVSNFNLAFKSAAETLTIPTDHTAYWNMTTTPGTVSGTAVTLTPASYSYGRVLSFANDWRTTVDDSNALDLTSVGTIAVWIRPSAVDATANDTFILHKGHSSSTTGSNNEEAYWLRFSSGGKLELGLRYNNNNSITLESTALPQANKWYHVVAQWDNSVLAIYINGALNAVGTNPNSRAARTTSGNLVIGARHNATPPPPVPAYKGFNGYIDEIYLYKRLLRADEIAALSLMP